MFVARVRIIGRRYNLIKGDSCFLVFSELPQHSAAIHQVVAGIQFCAKRVVKLIAFVKM